MSAGARWYLGALLLSGCRFEAPGYDGTRYRCGPPDDVCPAGMRCVAGFCEDLDAPPPDARIVFEDGAAAIDAPADAPPPDAALPDAGPGLVTFGERPGATTTGVTADTYVGADLPADNNGGSSGLAADLSPDKVALLRFDVSAIPPGRVVTGAALHLWTTIDDELQAGACRVYLMLEAWDEDTATYEQRVAGIAWTTTGAGPGSRAITEVAEFAAPAVDTEYVVDLPAALVQQWVDSPALNYGLALYPHMSVTHGVTFVSSEAATAEKRPLLTVTLAP